MRDRSDIRRKGNGTRPAGVPPARPGPERIPLDILFEDADILAVYKPAGMIVHPAPGHTSGTLVNALLAHCPSIAGVGSVERPGIVHRLDRETSGVMVVAKTGRAYRRLRQMFEAHDVIRKTYLAVLHGAPSPREGTLETLPARAAHIRRTALVLVGGFLKAPYERSKLYDPAFSHMFREASK